MILLKIFYLIQNLLKKKLENEFLEKEFFADQDFKK